MKSFYGKGKLLPLHEGANMQNSLRRMIQSNTARIDWVVWGCMVTLALLSMGNVFYILATTGANNLSNDYAFFIPLINEILDGGYNWGHFFQDTFFVSHFQPLPILVYLANARLTGWNIYYELFFIAILSVMRVVLTYQALTILCPKRLKMVMLPLMAMLVFSLSQISSYEFGASAVPLGLTAFGFTLAVWGLVKYPRRGTGLVYMIVGGLIASWTAASGVIAWPIFLALMLLLGYRKLTHLVTWLASVLVVNFPYLYFLVIDRKPGVNAYLQSLFNPRLIANLLGRPFANGIGSTTEYLPMGETAGWIGLGLGLIGIGLIFAQGKSLRTQAAPALMFMVFGLLSAWQTSLYRVMIAPWYTNMVMPYWIGLVGLAYALVSSKEQSDATRGHSLLTGKRMRWWFLVVVMVTLGVFYISANLTYQDKSFYLASRRPVSAACLRNYAWAPTYCERYVFQWSINRVPLDEFAWPLQHHSLSVFAQRQEWSMQGDVILGRVYSPENPESSGARWVDGLSYAPAEYTDYRHLNLLVTPINSAVWGVVLPENLQDAALVSATGLPAEPDGGGQDGLVSFEVYLSAPGQAEQLIYTRGVDVTEGGWDSFSLPLKEYQGKKIAIRFAVKGGSVEGAALYRYPMIELTLQSTAGTDVRPDIRPLNTDLSPEAPQAQPGDYVFNLNTALVSGMTPASGETSIWLIQSDPYFYFPLQEPLDLTEFEWVSFRMRAPADIPSLAAEIFLFVEGQEQPLYVVMPLLMDGEMHTYFYPLRLLEADRILTAFRLDPVMLPPVTGEVIVTVEEARLIRLP